ncbi:hypothetical protein LEP1GSC203_1244 [Leptospira terpstrae serovar Hualin str. LT 11-33 = ATCC 700639]|uniref:Uncharacterized protein n=1 Tax=Leptospira terpstrae serovar Hualin str. LT 11-33 = ATCC 700639 TaxID=1257025 RepID=N1VVZ1_9LEPT|nr:hypothetical protein LEP1GSC203_1244 [Leptospira terpstrae serovar Hualin str. LT 11-33 = ATCC 700639]
MVTTDYLLVSFIVSFVSYNAGKCNISLYLYFILKLFLYSVF